MTMAGKDMRDERLTEELGRLFAQDGAGPDLTRKIMGRLGFMRGSERAAARARRGKLMQRGAWAAAGILAGFTGWQVFQYSDMARRPAAVTVSSAVEHDLAASSTKLNETVERVARLISLSAGDRFLTGGAADGSETGGEKAVGGGGDAGVQNESAARDGVAEEANGESVDDREDERGVRAWGGSGAPMWMTPGGAVEHL